MSLKLMWQRFKGLFFYIGSLSSFCIALLISVLLGFAPSLIARRNKKRGLLFFYLIQDIEILASASQEFRKLNISYITYVDRKLIRKHPKIFLLLYRHKMPYFFSLAFWKKSPSLPPINNFAFVLTAVETSWGPHAPAHQIVKEANKFGVPTYTCQHGYENIGLTFDEKQHPIENTHISSSRIFIWSTTNSLHPRVRRETRDKCIETGFLKSLEFDGSLQCQFPPHFRLKIGVFENLHWARFSQEYRACFISSLSHVVTEFPQVLFVVKPHPAGQWLTKTKALDFLQKSNVLLLSKTNVSLSLFSTMDWIGNLDAVITTPSTVAVDGALLDKPVGVIGGLGLDLGSYEPLRLILTAPDWTDFIKTALVERESLVKLSRAFVIKNSIRKAGWACACQNILEQLETGFSLS